MAINDGSEGYTTKHSWVVGSNTDQIYIYITPSRGGGGVQSLDKITEYRV